MRSGFIIVFLLTLFTVTVKGQQNVVRGQVTDATNAKLPSVLVKNITNSQVTLTTDSGNFEIRGLIGNTLIISSPGYVSDTLFVADMKFKNVKMTPLGITLGAVNVRGQRFDPRVEYAQVYQKSKVHVLSPTTWFGKEAKDARRLKKYFEKEVEERHVDSVFTKVYVGSLVPLKGVELDNFMSLYRPTYEFVRSNGGASMAAYINDSYKKYQALPPEKRVVPKLTSEVQPQQSKP
ncbi:carboxypeptidase-like regulatory domain-containing protein [uncultured Mucilaginibacter sp.]|uniref:carboxypeptidase-like regulatory domain-containing protein n=1 Tax=uncultured Mucilaginibacter sp. TaxID=797541 RepID=UPI0025EC99C5|nr:carboxypeptidase-like regulatory domain-containing protein [uncultured Mucilaginibacter sp.]